ncbi:MAG: DUF928 domain-containing protein [Cyanobacteria bacterium J06626_6]
MQLSTSTALLAAIAVFSSSALSLPSFASDSATSNLRQGLPGRRISGGVRMEPPADSCFADFHQSLVAIMPRSNLGTTAASHPTFWFSIPETTGSKAVEFQLFNEEQELIYAAQLEMGNEFGLREFQLPSSAPALATDKNYNWVFSLACNNGSQSPVLGLEGWVRRVELGPETASSLAMGIPEERLNLYRTAGLWQEQVTELANLRRRGLSTPDVELEWAALVQSTGLAPYLSNDISDGMSPIEVSEVSVETSASIAEQVRSY